MSKLILTRRACGDRVMIRMGEQVVAVGVAKVTGDKVQLSFEADAAVTINREEVESKVGFVPRRRGVVGAVGVVCGVGVVGVVGV